MEMDFGVLDYVWRGLVVATLTSTFILSLTLIVCKVLSRSLGQRQLKWYLNVHLGLLALALIGEFAVLALIDPDLASGCFARFAKQESAFNITRILAGLWFGGVVLFGLFDLVRVAFSLRSMTFVRSIAREDIVARASAISRRLRLCESVSLGTLDGACGPFAFGILRHRVVIPSSLLDDAEKLETVLAHELAHVRDRDSLWMSLELLCRRVLFFNPLMIVFSREYSLTVERAADEVAVGEGGIRPAQLARTLVDLVTDFVPERGLPLRVGASRGFRDLKSRLDALSVNRRGPSAPKVFAAVLALSATASVGVAVAQASDDARSDSKYEERMCVQVRHEKIIESWLRIEREANKCE